MMPLPPFQAQANGLSEAKPAVHPCGPVILPDSVSGSSRFVSWSSTVANTAGENEGTAFTAGVYDESRRGWLYPGKMGGGDAKDAFTKRGKKLFKWDDWNSIRILCEGERIRIYLNGELRVDFTDQGEHSTPEGFFGLQVHSGKSCKVAWRNLRIKEL